MLVFLIDVSAQPLVPTLQRQQLLLVERGKTGPLDASQVAPGAFNPQNLDRLPGKRICIHHLRTCVAARKIGDAQVRPQQVRPVAQ